MSHARGSRDDGGAQAAFREARGYTVRVRTQIETPFLEDERGALEGAGFLVDAARGWIVTNAHVAGRSPSVVQVSFAGLPFQPARKLYIDSFADIAILAIAPPAGSRHAASLDPLTSQSRLQSFIPTADGLRFTRDVAHEYVGLLQYAARGWLRF